MSTTVTGLKRKQNMNIAGNISASALSLSGTLAAGDDITLSNDKKILLGNTASTDQWQVYDSGNKFIVAMLNTGGPEMSLTTDGANHTMAELRVGEYLAWTSGNHGTGSGLDADKLDGIEGSDLMKKTADSDLSFDIPDSSGTLTSSNKIKFNGASDWHYIYAENHTSTGSRLVFESADDAGDNDYTLFRHKFYDDSSAKDLLEIKYGEVNSLVPLKENGYQVYHANNLSPVVLDGANQSVGNGFTVNGLLTLANNGSTIGGELYILNKNGTRTLEFDSMLSNAHNSTTSGLNIVLGGADGSAKFAGSVKVNNLVVSTSSGAPFTINSTDLVSKLNAEYLGGLKWDMYDTKISNYEVGGEGVYAGMYIRETSTPTMAVRADAGTVYLQDGSRYTFEGTESISVPQGDASYDRIDVVYVAGSGSNKGDLQLTQGTPASSPTVPSIPSDGVKLAELRIHAGATTVTDGTSGATDMIDDRRYWKRVRWEGGSTFNVLGSIKEGGTLLTSKYAQLAADNIFAGDITIKKRSASLTIQGEDSNENDAYSPFLYLREASSSSEANNGFEIKYAGSSNTVSMSTVLGGTRTSRIYIARDSGLVTFANDVTVSGKIKGSNNATTVTIPAGQRQATWTHNYGATTYAVNLTSNSFERHIRWKDKLDNSITVEIDNPSDQETLVDIILIGY